MSSTSPLAGGGLLALAFLAACDADTRDLPPRDVPAPGGVEGFVQPALLHGITEDGGSAYLEARVFPEGSLDGTRFLRVDTRTGALTDLGRVEGRGAVGVVGRGLVYQRAGEVVMDLRPRGERGTAQGTDFLPLSGGKLLVTGPRVEQWALTGDRPTRSVVDERPAALLRLQGWFTSSALLDRDGQRLLFHGPSQALVPLPDFGRLALAGDTAVLIDGERHLLVGPGVEARVDGPALSFDPRFSMLCWQQLGRFLVREAEPNGRELITELDDRGEEFLATATPIGCWFTNGGSPTRAVWVGLDAQRADLEGSFVNDGRVFEGDRLLLTPAGPVLLSSEGPLALPTSLTERLEGATWAYAQTNAQPGGRKVLLVVAGDQDRVWVWETDLGPSGEVRRAIDLPNRQQQRLTADPTGRFGLLWGGTSPEPEPQVADLGRGMTIPLPPTEGTRWANFSEVQSAELNPIRWVVSDGEGTRLLGFQVQGSAIRPRIVDISALFD